MSQKNIPEADADQEIEDSVAMGPEGEASRAGSARETIVNERTVLRWAQRVRHRAQALLGRPL